MIATSRPPNFTSLPGSPFDGEHHLGLHGRFGGGPQAHF
jgi:hypothetical protein